MNRRQFLQSVGALALCPSSSFDPKPVIKKFDDGYTIEVGILRCLTEDGRHETTLNFSVFLTTYPVPGVVREDRMNPTDELKRRLEQAGFPVKWEIWHPDFPFLIARMNPGPEPHDIATRLQRVLGGCDSTLLYTRPTDLHHEPDAFLVR